MQIRDWMTTDVVTATPETSMLKVSKMMKEYNIRRVPVVDPSHHVIGIISDRDVKDASPSKATTLDMHELYYLLSEVKARDIMTPNPVTVNLRDTVERVALLILERGIGGLPVVDDDGLLVGIITDHDLFKILVEVSGVRKGGVQMAVAFRDGVGVAAAPVRPAARAQRKPCLHADGGQQAGAGHAGSVSAHQSHGAQRGEQADRGSPGQIPHAVLGARKRPRGIAPSFPDMAGRAGGFCEWACFLKRLVATCLKRPDCRLPVKVLSFSGFRHCAEAPTSNSQHVQGGRAWLKSLTKGRPLKSTKTVSCFVSTTGAPNGSNM